MAEEKGSKTAERRLTKPGRSRVVIAADHLIRALASAARRLAADATVAPETSARTAGLIAKALRDAVALQPPQKEDTTPDDDQALRAEILGRLARRAAAAGATELCGHADADGGADAGS